MSSNPGKSRWLAVGLLLGLLLFHALTWRSGHDWGGDFAMYLAHAENLVNGQGYADTGYVVNPHRPRIGPTMYPPGWPALLAMPMALFEVDFDVRPVEGLELLKGWMLAIFLGFLAAAHAFARGRLGPWASAAVLLAVGLNPYFWELKTSLISELPFCLLLYLGLWRFERGAVAETPQRLLRADPSRALLPAAKRPIGAAIVTGLCFYAAYATRAIGLVFLPMALLHDLVRFRRLRLTTLVVLAVVVPLALLQNQLFDVLSGYGAGVEAGLAASAQASDAAAGTGLAEALSGMLRNSVSNAKAIPLILAWAWGGGLPIGGDMLLNLCLFATAAAGFVATVRERIRAGEILFIGYLGGLSLLPESYVDLRRIAPLLPLFFLYVVRGTQVFASPGVPAGLPAGVPARAAARLARAGLAILVASAYVGSYAKLEREALAEGVHTVEAQQLFGAVRAQVPADGLCFFFKPRVLAHFSDRRSAGFWETAAPAELIRQADELGVTHLIAGPGGHLAAPLRACQADYPARLEEVWSNRSFALLRLAPSLRSDAER